MPPGAQCLTVDLRHQRLSGRRGVDDEALPRLHFEAITHERLGPAGDTRIHCYSVPLASQVSPYTVDSTSENAARQLAGTGRSLCYSLPCAAMATSRLLLVPYHPAMR